MEAIPSDRGHLWTKDGFLYKSNKCINGVRYLTCIVDTCRCCASFREGEEVRVGDHNHPQNALRLEELKFKAEVKKRATVDVGRAPKDIYTQVSRL